VDWNATQHELALTQVANVAAPTPPNQGGVSVRDLGVDNTATVITLGEILDILAEKPGATPRAKVAIVDARGGAEALGLAKATSTGRTDCASYNSEPQNRRCSTPFEGRIKGAKSVPWTQFIDTAVNGFQFLPKAQVKQLFESQAGVGKQTKYVVQYCRTNQRSTVTGIAASVILGYPTRFYETSFIEWGHIASGPTPNTQIVPPDSALRTDLARFTEHAVLSDADAANYVPGLPLAAGVVPAAWVDGPNYNADADISPVTDSWPPVDGEAEAADQSVAADRAYLRE
jgi:thiosulfate/3-mercaptopyruvate sulfurtransferase